MIGQQQSNFYYPVFSVTLNLRASGLLNSVTRDRGIYRLIRTVSNFL